MVIERGSRLVSAALIVVASSSLVYAADLPSRRAPPPVYVAPPAFTWTGFYVGVNAGYGFNASNNSSSVTVPAGTFAGSPGTAGTLSPSGQSKDGGFVGGGQIGYNYQVGHIVFGVETDIQYADLGRGSSNYGYTFAGTGSLPATFTAVDNRRNIDWFGTVRGRVGYAFDTMPLLVYGTGGLAYGGGSSSSSSCTVVTCNDDTKVGYAVGAGAEYAFTPNWTAKIEGLYVNLGKSGTNAIGYDLAGTVYTVASGQQDQDFGVVRAGLNYKF